VVVTQERCPNCLQAIERCVASGCGQRRPIPPVIEHERYLRLVDQAHAVATYHQHLIDGDLAPGDDDDRSALECAADHVAQLAGYRGADANAVSDMLWRSLRAMQNAPRQVSTSSTPKYRALCATCGYVGRSFESKADADADGDAHEIAVGSNAQHHHARTVES
jgi:hypothetical protein